EVDSRHRLVAGGDIRKEADMGHPDFHVPGVVQSPVRVVYLIHAWGIGPFYVQHYQTLRARRNVGIGAYQIYVLGLSHRHCRAANRLGCFRIGNIDDLYAVSVANKRVPELDLDGPGIPYRWSAKLCNYSWLQWVVDADDDQAAVARDVGVGAGDCNVVCPVKNSARIKRSGPFQEIVRRVAVQQSGR